jgi:hypothetical protein
MFYSSTEPLEILFGIFDNSRPSVRPMSATSIPAIDTLVYSVAGAKYCEITTNRIQDTSRT